jgi:hypothetical protein
MALFPPEWQIYRAEDFHTFTPIPLADTGTTVHTLLLLDNEGGSTGNFRICLSGREGITAHFSLARVLDNPPPNLANVALTYSASLAEVSPPVNSTSTAWVDLSDLLRNRSVLPSNGPDQNTVLKCIIAALGNLEPKHGVGASLRWAVTGSAATGGLQLELQALPSPARLLTKNNLKGDNAISIVLSTRPLHAEFFDGVSHSGPVPSMFATHQRTARAALRDDPDGTHDAVRLLNGRFLHHEHMTLPAAVAYLKAPKARAAKGTPAFPATGPPNDLDGPPTSAAKRSRRDAPPPQDLTDTGTDTSFIVTFSFTPFNTLNARAV